jgi:hypothetical protein
MKLVISINTDGPIRYSASHMAGVLGRINTDAYRMFHLIDNVVTHYYVPEVFFHPYKKRQLQEQFGNELISVGITVLKGNILNSSFNYYLSYQYTIDEASILLIKLRELDGFVVFELNQ